MSGSKATELEKAWDDIRSIMGWCPLYEGVMAEKDSDAPAVPIRFMQQLKQSNHKCKYCNVNRDGQHQDFCPASSLAKPKRRVNQHFVSSAFR